MVLSTRASKVVRMGLRGLMVRFSTFLDAPRRALVPGLPERTAAVTPLQPPENRENLKCIVRPSNRFERLLSIHRHSTTVRGGPRSGPYEVE